MAEVTDPPPPEPADVHRAVALKRSLVGRPLAADQLEETLLSKFLALPIFASDALSSVAYATEAALVVLVAASASAAHLILPISIAIALLLVLVAASYRQVVYAYQSSGGSYVVARENLGTAPSLVAGAALLIDYVLTVAVSVSAGILAISSVAPSVANARVLLAVLAVVLLCLANLRGVREAGLLFAVPTYGFIITLGLTIVIGVARCAAGDCPRATVPHPIPAGMGAVTVFVVLRAFASGSSALTGVEAISNGVTAFKRPQARNAAQTLAILAGCAVFLFVGVSFLADQLHARPSTTNSVVSQVARAVFPSGSASSVLFYLVQGFTLAILVLAANTSFQGFPRLLALIARDRFAPIQFINLGDRLVFSNGIVFLAGLAIALIVGFQADVNSLIHLYVVGVFTAFTLAQAGMVRHWRRVRSAGWRRAAAINGVGSAATGLVTALVVATKFFEGAWAVIVTIPLLVLAFYATRRHYRWVARRLRAGATAVAAVDAPTNEVVLFVDGLDPATRHAAWYADVIGRSAYRPVAVANGAPDLAEQWRGVPEARGELEMLDPGAGRAEAVINYVYGIPRGEGRFVTLVVAEQFGRRSLLAEGHHLTELELKYKLLREPGVVVADVTATSGEEDDAVPGRMACRVLVTDAHAGSLRAVAYASTLGVPDTELVSFAHDPEQAERRRQEWASSTVDLPLSVREAPYRDLAAPVLHCLRELTADPQAEVILVLPELILPGWRRLLHNQRALYFKRLLLFEPRVILTSVPYQLS